jgi:hypothetical protein
MLPVGRLGAVGLAVAIALGTAPARAVSSCDWVSSVQKWNGILNWSYSHDASWSDDYYNFHASTGDTGSVTFQDTGMGFTTDITGTLAFLDDLHQIPKDPHEQPQFSVTSLTAVTEGPSVVDLTASSITCEYFITTQVLGSGTNTSQAGTYPVTNNPTHLIQTQDLPIPSTPGPLVFSDVYPVSYIQVVPRPFFQTHAQSAGASAVQLGEGQLGTAQVSWVIQPDTITSPLNDVCEGAPLLVGLQQQDATNATSGPSDPTPSCGSGDHSVWYWLVPERSGPVTISTAGSAYSTLLSVWLKTACGLLTTELACGKDHVTFQAQAGVPVLVEVGRTGAPPAGGLQIEATPEPAWTGSGAVATLALAGIGALRRKEER